MSAAFFKGMMPALMTPCGADRRPDFDALVAKAAALMDTGMSAVIYCGSMGDWPLVSDADRMEGVARLTAAGIPVGADEQPDARYPVGAAARGLSCTTGGSCSFVSGVTALCSNYPGDRKAD